MSIPVLSRSDAAGAECLICWVKGARISIPVLQIEGIAEYQFAPLPPITHEWIGGVVLEDDALFILVCLRNAAAQTPAATQSRDQTRKGVLVRQQSTATPRWALEVDSIERISGVRRVQATQPREQWNAPGHWLQAAEDDAGAHTTWLDVNSVTAALEGA